MSGACEAAFDPQTFRKAFGEFKDAALYLDDDILSRRSEAECFISPKPGRLSVVCLARALDLMTAHLLALQDKIRTGAPTGMVSSASVDKVSVSMTPPPFKNQFQYWLGLTARGQELLALLKSKAAGGIYVGGTPAERDAFRKAGGVFING